MQKLGNFEDSFSEGTIMPLLEVLSAMNRALLYEIGDVTDKKALEFFDG